MFFGTDKFLHIIFVIITIIEAAFLARMDFKTKKINDLFIDLVLCVGLIFYLIIFILDEIMY